MAQARRARRFSFHFLSAELAPFLRAHEVSLPVAGFPSPGAGERTPSPCLACFGSGFPPVRLSEGTGACARRSEGPGGERERERRAGKAWEGHRAVSSAPQGRRPRRRQVTLLPSGVGASAARTPVGEARARPLARGARAGGRAGWRGGPPGRRLGRPGRGGPPTLLRSALEKLRSDRVPTEPVEGVAMRVCAPARFVFCHPSQGSSVPPPRDGWDPFCTEVFPCLGLAWLIPLRGFGGTLRPAFGVLL